MLLRFGDTKRCFRGIVTGLTFVRGFNLGIAYYAVGQEANAESCFRMALIAEPSSHAARANLAQLCLAPSA